MQPKKSRPWHDPKFWPWAIQFLVLVLMGLLLAYCGNNLVANLQQKQLGFGFDFLGSQAGFNIGETSIPYTPTDTYAQALRVGLINSLRIMIQGLVFATLIGTGVGIARLSSNWLVRQLGTIYVELLRNVPLLIQLMFWYFAVFLSAPPLERRIQFIGDVSLSQRGLLLPNFLPKLSLLPWMICLGIGVAIAQWVFRTLLRRRIEGEPASPWFMAIITIIFWGCIAWILTKELPWNFAWPMVQNNKTVTAGLLLTPEYSAILFGLTFYTAAFIAEIVRGGILSVPKGQWEAARSLGLSPTFTLQKVIMPQAMRVIVPPLTSQYLNLAKNSSLAIAVGYPDLYSVSSTTFNQTGRAVEVILLLMATYLTISLIISIVMNLYNRRIQIVER